MPVRRTEGNAELYRAPAVSGINTPWIDTQPYEVVRIVSHDGLNLEGLFLPGPAPLSGPVHTVILAHGYTGDARQLSGFARLFYEQYGFTVLLPHARGHGASEGAYIGFGWPDRLDNLRWMDWVIERTSSPRTPARIILFGVSMGAASVLMTGGEDPPPELEAIIEDCGYTSVDEQLRHILRRNYHIRGELLLRIASGLAKKWAAYSFEEASALNQVKKIRVPTLFIHGEADDFVPYEMVYPLYEACTAPKERYTVTGAGHGQAYDTDPGEYRRRLDEFLKKYVL
jgi:fermentation-respiration switch protein FrsA (DUF1100 family)